MNRSLLSFCVCLCLVLGSACGMAGEPVRMIFDTDMGNDVDDALALAMIHTLQDRGEVELLAVTVTKSHPLAAEYVDALNTFYGHPDIPIGIVKNGPTPEEGRFNKLAAIKDGETLRYPHDLDGETCPEATGVLRKVLAAQPDGSVVMVQVGFSSNLARLLKSGPDEHSKLDGTALVKQKVKLLSTMAGYFRTLPIRGQFGEYNVQKDIPAAQLIATEWPTPIIYSGWEIGRSIEYPSESILRDYNYVKHHPVAEAYQLYEPAPHNRPTWDLTSVLQVVYPDRGYFTLSEPGTVVVADNARSTFKADPAGTHRYLVVSPEQVIRVKEAFVWLSSTPPPHLQP